MRFRILFSAQHPSGSCDGQPVEQFFPRAFYEERGPWHSAVTNSSGEGETTLISLFTASQPALSIVARFASRGPRHGSILRQQNEYQHTDRAEKDTSTHSHPTDPSLPSTEMAVLILIWPSTRRKFLTSSS